MKKIDFIDSGYRQTLLSGGELIIGHGRRWFEISGELSRVEDLAFGICRSCSRFDLTQLLVADDGPSIFRCPLSSYLRKDCNFHNNHG